jgi:hypothetical protein
MCGEVNQGIGNQSVDTFTFDFGLDGQLGVKFWANTEGEIA